MHSQSLPEEIVYEVECILDPEIVADFDAWLPGHVRDVLRSPGFVRAETYRPAEPGADGKVRRVNRYRVRDRAALDHYLEQLAPALREDGAKRFGGRARYERRVLATIDRYGAEGVDPECANCGASLVGPYCAQCGQHAHESARSMGALLHDGWHVLTHVDGRFWLTLRHLLLKPGHLTNEYFAERRARYIPPVRLYVILSLVFFGLASLTNAIGGSQDATAFALDGARAESDSELAARESELAAARVQLADARRRLEENPGAAVLRSAVATLESKVAQAERALAEERTGRNGIAAAQRAVAPAAGDPGAAARAPADARPGSATPADTSGVAPAGTDAATRAGTQPAGPAAPARIESRDTNDTFDPSDCDRVTVGGPPWLGEKVREACRRQARDGGKTLLHAFVANIPKMMFVFLPLMAAVMLLLYWRPRRYYVEHLVFYLHTHAGLFLALTLLILLGAIASVLPPFEPVVGLAGFATFFYAVWYVYRAMRVHYRNGRTLTLLKFAAIGFFYVVFLAFTLVGNALVSALTA